MFNGVQTMFNRVIWLVCAYQLLLTAENESFETQGRLWVQELMELEESRTVGDNWEHKIYLALQMTPSQPSGGVGWTTAACIHPC